MPIQLNERLSEFSYGYGITREFEQMLTSAGLSAVPFLPSLLHEAELGFDVGFNQRGTPLLLQFKLGQAMRRFVPGPRPILDQPFWRFGLNTAEPDGQFELLLKAETDGADVFYVAPKFHDWEIYLQAFESQKVVADSLIVRPSIVRLTLDQHGVSDGPHKIVYDQTRAYLCTKPQPILTINPNSLMDTIKTRLSHRHETLGETLTKIYQGFSNRESIRRYTTAPSEANERAAYSIPSDVGIQPHLREVRLGRLRERASTEDDAIALAVGVEAWSSGAQLILVTTG